MADEQPSAAEQVLLFGAVDVVAHEELAADRSVHRVDHTIEAVFRHCVPFYFRFPAARLATVNVLD